MDRRIKAIIQQDLERKMVFLAGPRQCGKTTLAKKLDLVANARYYNWDLDRDRKLLLASQLDPEKKLWIFDELHKNRRWRNWLKGIYDTQGDRHQIIVTGSAKLDLYSRGGDSLQGRYFFHRLHPLTQSEAVASKTVATYTDFATIKLAVNKSHNEVLAQLLALGGFPEPFLSGSQRYASRWRNTYGTSFVREEIRSVEQIKDLDRLELLFDRLGDCAGSILSINNLREDLEVAFETARSWIQVLERLYGVFRVPPFGPAKIKAVKKEQKIYMWDWTRVSQLGARWENLVALHLLRLVHWLHDVEGEKVELRYLRDVTGKEVDFLLLRNNKPWVAIEVKLQHQDLDPNLRYFLQRVHVPYALQIHLQGDQDYALPTINGCRVRMLPGVKLLAQLP